MANIFPIFFILLSAFVLVQSIDITTSTFAEIYSGPGGTISSEYRNPETSITYSKYISTVNFVIMGTSKEEYMYKQVAEAFAPPTLKVIKGEGVVDPVLYDSAATGYYFDATNVYWLEMPELGIYFNCQKDGTATIEITILASLIDEDRNVKNETIIFYMRKTCNYSGFRDGFAIGYAPEKNEDVVKHGVVQSGWSLESYEFFGTEPMVIPNTEHSTLFRISISNPAYGNQYYDEPRINVENRDVLDLQVRGNAEKGGVAKSIAETLYLFYTCKQEGESNVVITISLGFYGVIEFGFVKICGNDGAKETAGVINVGVSKSDYSNVVSNSRTSSLWNADAPSTTVGTDDLLSIFYISTLSGREQPFLSPIVTVYPPTAFSVTVSGSVRDGGVATGNPQRFVVNYICEKVSEGRIVVTIKLPGFDTIEFGFTKKCVKLVRHHDHIWTANQILIALLSVFGVILLLGIFFVKRRRSELSQRKIVA